MRAKTKALILLSFLTVLDFLPVPVLALGIVLRHS